MSIYTGQFGKNLAMLGQFQFGGVATGVGVPGSLGTVTSRERWMMPAYALCWTDMYEVGAWAAEGRTVRWDAPREGVTWSAVPRRMTNV